MVMGLLWRGLDGYGIVIGWFRWLWGGLHCSGNTMRWFRWLWCGLGVWGVV